MTVETTAEAKNPDRRLGHAAQPWARYSSHPRDLVTGLPGQIELEALLNVEAMNQRCFGLLVIAIPAMSRINNALGHHVGDLVAATVAARLSEIRSDAVVSPLSGGNFGVGIPGIEHQDELLTLISAITEIGQREVPIGAMSLSAPITVGATIAAPGTGALTALRDAEVAVQGALDQGVPMLIFTPSMRRNTSAAFELSYDLRSALSLGQIQLFLQPQVDLRTGELVGAEGLARWRHPDRGLLLPADFLEMVELSNLYERFTRHVLNSGIDALDQLQAYSTDLRVSINTPLRMLRDPCLVDDIVACLDAVGVSTSHFVVEITESSFSDPTIEPRDMIDNLRRHGIGVSLDDFGTDYSSLSRLADLDVSELKIDRAFVRRLDQQDSRARAIVKSIIELAHGLDLYVVAEGVETPAQRAALLHYGCEIGQGFLFGRPMSLPELTALLQRQRRIIG